jgi:hypothetical protein
VRLFFPRAGGLKRLPALAIQSLSIAAIDFAALGAGSFAAQLLPPSFRVAGGIAISAALGAGGVLGFLSRPIFGPSYAPSGRDDYARIYLGALVWNPVLLALFPCLFGGFGGGSPILHAVYFQMPVNFIAIQIMLFKYDREHPPSPPAHPSRPPEDPERYTRPYRPPRKNNPRPM